MEEDNPKEGIEKETKAQQKEPIGIISLIFAHYLLGLGIAIIGHRIKNKLEFYGGIAFAVFAIGLFLAPMFLFECSYECTLFQSDLAYYVPACEGCLWIDMGQIAGGLMGLLSWAYIVLRLALIFKNKETELKIL